MFRLVFGNTIFCKSHFTNHLIRIYGKYIRHSYPESTKKHTKAGLEENIFKTKVLRCLLNAILTSVFANTVYTSYTLFQQLREYYTPDTEVVKRFDKETQSENRDF